MNRRLFLAAALAAPQAMPAAKTTSLFNGRDMTGWVHAGNGLWTVEEECLVGRFDTSKPGPGYLFTMQDFSDFRLGLDFFVSTRGNSGVYIREPLRKWGSTGDDRPAHGERRGYEVQIDYHDRKNLTGALYDTKNATKVVGADERWNRMEIECTGDRIKVWVNGEMVNDYSPSRSPSGRIGLQMHGGKAHDHVVRFRKIEVTPAV